MQFGIVGCGTIAQIMHLPYLTEIPETDVYALVDPAEGRVNALADRYGVPYRFEDTDSFLAEVGDELDAVVVLTPAHAHADVVKTLEDAERMVDAAARSDTTAIVTYMKRCDPAYERVRETLNTLAGIDLITAYDVDPDHFRVIDEVYDLVEADLPRGSSRKAQRSAAGRSRARSGPTRRWSTPTISSSTTSVTTSTHSGGSSAVSNGSSIAISTTTAAISPRTSSTRAATGAYWNPVIPIESGSSSSSASMRRMG